MMNKGEVNCVWLVCADRFGHLGIPVPACGCALAVPVRARCSLYARPLKVLMHLKRPPRVVVLHRGRDEETTRDKVIQYRHINRLHSKFDVLISAAGGVDLREARSAIFNGANIVVANVVSPGKPWQGMPATGDVGEMAKRFLSTIE